MSGLRVIYSVFCISVISKRVSELIVYLNLSSSLLGTIFSKALIPLGTSQEIRLLQAAATGVVGAKAVRPISPRPIPVELRLPLAVGGWKTCAYHSYETIAGRRSVITMGLFERIENNAGMGQRPHA